MTIRNTQFVGNQGSEGGAIVFDTLPILIDSCSFTNNYSTVNAGAIATTNVVGTLVGAPHNFVTTITNSNFTNNTTLADQYDHDNFFFPFSQVFNFARGGGALVAYINGYLNVDHCSFVNNTAVNSDGGAILNGNASGSLGPVSAYAVTTTVTNSSFTNNSAPNGSGGAIASESDGRIPASTVADTVLNVSGSTFTNNKSGVNGGAISLNSSTAMIVNSLFKNNSGTLGSAIFGNASAINNSSNTVIELFQLQSSDTFVHNDIYLQ